MDYLYDKLTVRRPQSYHARQSFNGLIIPEIQHQMMDIEHHMLHFLDNHDEQRIASPEFVGGQISRNQQCSSARYWAVLQPWSTSGKKSENPVQRMQGLDSPHALLYSITSESHNIKDGWIPLVPSMADY